MRIRPFIAFSLAALVLAPANSVARDPVVTARYDELQMFVDSGAIDSEEIRRFFAWEAAEAGVVKIRAMEKHEHREKTHIAQTGCGRALGKTREVLINTDKASCINLANLAHEIAHMPAKDRGCRGHGDLFYEINEGIAERFEQRFPGKMWGRHSPVESVRKRAGEYRSPC